MNTVPSIVAIVLATLLILSDFLDYEEHPLGFALIVLLTFAAYYFYPNKAAFRVWDNRKNGVE